VVGRIVGSFLSLLTAVAFFSISVWSSGDAVVGAAQRLLGLAPSDALFAIAYGVFALAVLAISVYGFRLMLLVNKIAVVSASALFLLGFWAFRQDFDPAFAGAGLAVGSAKFTAAFVQSTLVVLANPISFGAFLGDWTRYLPSHTSPRRLMAASVLAQVLTLLPFVFGLATATVIARMAPAYLAQADYTGGLIAVAPAIFAVPLLLLATLSGLSTGTTSLYGTGLDFSSVFPSLSRARATMLIGALSIALIFVGRFLFNVVDAITTFVALIVVMTTPWMMIMMIGYWVRRGYYLPEAMQVFNRGQVGGPYWYWRGWNRQGIAAWWLSAIVSLLAVNMPGHFVGWIGRYTGDLDLSIAAALLLPLLLYPMFLTVSPEPRGVYGPAGSRGVPTRECALAPVEGGR
jgi:purine-cytosine permease-like protein